MGCLCQGERRGHLQLPKSRPGFGAAPSLKPCTCSRTVLSSCLAQAALFEPEDGVSSCRQSNRGIFSRQNFNSHFLIVLPIIAGFANDVLLNLSQPPFL